MVVLNCAETRKLEQDAINNGKTYLKLMEKAGNGASKIIKHTLKRYIDNVVILCGSGNNGGDGFVVARKLCEKSELITVILTNGTPKTDIAKAMFERILDVPNIIILEYDDPEVLIAIENANLIVDAMFGIGFKGKVREEYAKIIDIVNESNAVKMALDLPSGIQCDTGTILGKCIKADYTVTFSSFKPAQVLYPSADYCGQVIVKNVGISNNIIDASENQAEIVTHDIINSIFKRRASSSNKGSIGTLLTVCGSYSMAGAAMLSSEAALRSGAGLVKTALPKSIYPIVAAGLPECVYKPLDENIDGTISNMNKELILKEANNSDAVLIGCGITNNLDSKEIVYYLIRNSKTPIIIDADGINVISDNINILKEAQSKIILTPHPKEMSRLTGMQIKKIQQDRINIAKNFSNEYKVTLILKGENTVISSPNQIPMINRTGNPGMATGGSGDVLAGVVASLVSQGYSTVNSALLGTYIHGLAGDIAASKYSETSMLPSDIIDCLGDVFKQLENDCLR